LVEQDLELYLSLIEDLADESGGDIAEIAAAATFLAVGDKPLEVAVEPEPEQFKFSEEGMVRLFINVGRRHHISPGDIVGAIANEADVPGKAIGAIDVNDRFTLVDIPSEFVEQVLKKMSTSRIRKQNLDVRLASSAGDNHDKPFREGRDKTKKREKSRVSERKSRKKPFKRKSSGKRAR
jgi:ATP-dependent RNA helicase DeaD